MVRLLVSSALSDGTPGECGELIQSVGRHRR
jgi:hypothetical protein